MQAWQLMLFRDMGKGKKSGMSHASNNFFWRGRKGRLKGATW